LQRAIDGLLGGGKIAAQLMGEGIHREEIGIVSVGPGQPRHVTQEARPLMLLAKNIVEKFRDLRGQQITRPAPGDIFQRVECAQMILTTTA
jgi:hypothetical protein